MHIGIQTWGTDGDIRPLIALGSGLRAAGHEVTIAITNFENKDYSSFCETLDLQYIKVPEHIEVDLQALDEKTKHLNFPQSFKIELKELFYPYQDDMYQTATQLCQCSDVVIGHTILYPLKVAAIKTGTPFISVALIPLIFPTAYRPPGVFPNLAPGILPNLGKWLNRLMWKLGTVILDAALKKDIQRLWKQEGLPPFKHVLTDAWHSDLLNLIAVSPALCEQQPDWGTRHRICGFFNFPEMAESWTMPSELREFIKAGTPPVYMTFGSATQILPVENNIALLVDAAQQANCRTLIQTVPEVKDKYPANTRDKESENIYFVGPTPHNKIFPYCAAVVHHGGAGTVHTATRCGCPSVVVPFWEEELFWGQELHRIGVAGKPLPYDKVVPEKLALEIRWVLDSQSIHKQAAELGKRMRQENGVARAVELVHNIVASIADGNLELTANRAGNNIP